MLLLWAASAVAGIVDESGVGAVVVTHGEGGVAMGVGASSAGGGMTTLLALAPATRTLPVVRAWALQTGCHTPALIRTRSDRTRAAKSHRNLGQQPGVDDDEATAAGDPFLLGDPCIALSGNAWAHEAFRATFGGEGLLDLLHPAHVPVEDGWVGPTFGAKTSVVYGTDGSPGVGQLLLTGGFGAGIRGGDWTLARLDATAEWEPALGDVLLRGNALVTVSAAPVDAPVMLQVRGAVTVDPARDFAYGVETTWLIGYVLD